MHTLKQKITKLGLLLLKKTEALSALSCRLVQITGKHINPIHPKHLVKIRPPWYLSKLKKSDVVLDIGCNNGQHTLRIARVTKHVYAFDRDPHMLQLASQEIARLGIFNITLKQGDAQKRLPYKKNYFDAVVFLDVFEHLSKRDLVLKEISRVLKPHGKLLISIPKADTSWKKLQQQYGLFYFSDPDHKIEFTELEIRAVLRIAKFKITSVQPVTLDTPWVGFIDLVGGLSLRLYKKLSYWRREQALKHPNNSIGLEIMSEEI